MTAVIEDLRNIRQYLHQHPELSGYEQGTQRYLLNLLQQLDTDNVETIAGTGLLVRFNGNAKGRNILYRGDIDALPIQELNSFDHRSVNDGVSHKCGHDGHATIMYGLCRYYAANRPDKGNVYILFQPAEENGRGAKGVEDSGVLQQLDIDLVYAMHNVPGYPLHTVVCREGSFTPGVTTLIAHFTGHTAHAAEPWNGLNPAAIMSTYLLAALAYNMEDKQSHSFVTITPVCIALGDENAYGTSAGEGSVHLTVRADSNERLQNALNELKATAENIATTNRFSVNFEQKETFESNQNAVEAVRIIEATTAAMQLQYHDKDEPFRWGEDFGLFTNRIKGAMFGLGAGEDCKPLHHPEYDFPDVLLDTAIPFFITLHQQSQL